jgi:1-acyl-sn-glycerol-3-phosphate acyltransferase
MSERTDLIGVLNGDYRTPEHKIGFVAKRFPTLVFYRHMLREVFLASKNGKQGVLTEDKYALNAAGIIRGAERAGGRLEIDGFDNVPADGWPYVFVANHMSVLETFFFAAILYPKGDHMFVVKKSLTEYPVFKHVMNALDPVVVGRTNPREDLTEVLKKGTEKLQNGQSMIIFPQKTRAQRFEPSEFNTIGIKLARRAGVPVVPVALKTDFWGQGKLIKDFGGIFPEKTIHFAFGKPIEIKGKGQEEHEQIVKFIGEHYAKWEHE